VHARSGRDRDVAGARVAFVAFRPGLLSPILDVWGAAFGDAFPACEALLRQNTVEDPHFEPAGCRVACDHGTGRVLGFCIAKVAREPLGADGLLPDRGWISAIAVHPSAQRRGIGTALLRRAEAFLRRRRRARAVLGGDPAHFFPGVPLDRIALAFFAARGYRLEGDAYDLRRRIAGYRTPAAIRAAHPGLEIRPLRPGEEDALLAFLDATFPGRWRYDVARALAAGCDIADVVGVVRRGRVLGFARLFPPGARRIGPSIAWTQRERSRVGGLGPMGIAPALRGRGLGLALLDRAIVRLAALGADEVVIDWTSLLGFYGKLGFVPWKRYRHGERSLER